MIYFEFISQGFWIGHAITAAILFFIEMAIIMRVDWKKEAFEAHNREITLSQEAENNQDVVTSPEKNTVSNQANTDKLSNLDKKFPLKQVLIKCNIILLFIAIFTTCILTRNLYHSVLN